MPDKLVDITRRGTVATNELGLEINDQRGREGDVIVNKLFPTSAAGGGQSSQPDVVNRYRPGNRYKYVRANGTITQFNAVKRDITFATEIQRADNVINSVAVNDVLAGVWEQGTGGPLTTEPTLSSDAAGVFAFITTRGLAICNVVATVVAGDPLGTSAVAGQLSTMVVTTPTAAEVSRIMAAATGLGAHAMVTEPPTGFKANLTYVNLQ